MTETTDVPHTAAPAIPAGHEPKPPTRAPYWMPGQSPAWLSDPIAQCLAAVVAISVFFAIFPGVDPWFTSLFFEPGQGFPVAKLGFFRGVRELHSLMTWALAIVCVLAIIWKLIQPQRPSFIRPRETLFILGTLAVGPGLIVNGLFKSNWGRPRPYTVDLFGGDNPFIGVWQITDYCSRNCSFVSGESSSAIWLITAAVLVPEKWRPLALRILLGLAIVFAVNRIAFGAHFLSDVLLAWFMTLALIAFAWRFLYITPPLTLSDQVMEERSTRNGEKLHALIRRLGGSKAGPA